ncbi:hypothetical protein FJY63_00215 [Candidatus Sumerlaeota bacterium]|nr:hypothetical protein [Candidatus Sumerlaeota bacterium]
MKSRGTAPEVAQDLFRAKMARRTELARLPIERKISILMELQKLAGDIRASMGKSKRPSWNLPRKRRPTTKSQTQRAP